MALDSSSDMAETQLPETSGPAEAGGKSQHRDFDIGDQGFPDSPPPELRFRKRVRIATDLRQLGRGVGVIRALTERDLRVRYKQAYLGVAWAVFSPAVLMIVFSLLLSHQVLNVGTAGKPAYLFSYVALIPWTIFSNSVSSGGMSLVNNLILVNKIYCPREVFPLASILVAIADGFVASLLLLILFPIGHTAPSGTIWWVPLLFLIELVYTVGVTLFLSVIIVYMRDLRQVVPVIVQFGLFATPVVYTMSKIPRHLQTIYAIINPIGPLIDGCRRAALLNQDPQWNLVGLAAISSSFALVVGYFAFRMLERRIADVA